MLDRVVESILRYSMFERGQRIGVAVSGGADSVALLHLLKELSSSWALGLSVVHLNHCLRGLESDQDEEFVARLAAEMALPFIGSRVDVAAEAGRRRTNLEQMARQARISYFAELISGAGLDRIALGHTKDDQAETLLFRILRGTGPDGLRGILPATSEGFVRPLLGIRRAELREYLSINGFRWREDSTNDDVRFSRNRIRHVLLPQLSRDWNPRVVDALARLGESAAEDNDYLETTAKELANRLWEPEGRALVAECRNFQQLPAALRMRVLRVAVRKVKGNLLQFEQRHLAVLDNLAIGRTGHGRAVFPGIEATRSLGLLRLQPHSRPAAGENGPYSVLVRPPCRIRPPAPFAEISFELIPLKEDASTARNELGAQMASSPRGAEASYNKPELDLDWDRLAGSLELRNVRPGDRYRPSGSSAPVKLKVLFQRARIPIWRRGGWPVLCCGERIVWSLRFGSDGDFVPGPGCRYALRIREVSANPSTLESPHRRLASQLGEGRSPSLSGELS